MRQLLLFLAFLLPVCVFSQQKGTVRINEIMADPKGLTVFPETEYVELYNTTDEPIQLADWQFMYAGKSTKLTSLLLSAHGYVVLYHAGKDIHIDEGGLGLPLDGFPRNLANAGEKTLALYSPSDILIDEITYGKAKKKIAWERSGGGLYLSKDSRGGTPGSINSLSEVDPVDPVEPEDPVVPELSAIQPFSASVFQLRYDKPVDIEEAVFSISDIGEASRSVYADDTRANVNISFEKELDLGKEYVLSCSGLKDAKGNKIPDRTEQIVLKQEEDPDTPDVPETPSFASGSILINEVMADPKGQTVFPETEYVELYNTTDETISLKGWTFLYGTKSTELTAASLEADEFVVLYRSGRDIHIDDSGQDMPLDKFPASLANTGKELALVDPSGKEIDRIAYEKAKAGIAWERSDTGLYLSTDERGGTPGSANSSPGAEPEDPDRPDTPDEPDIPTSIIVLPNEIVFNELLPNPFPEGSEYIELYNRSDRALPLAGLSVATRKSDGTLSTHYPLSSIASSLEPQGYALLTKEIEGVSAFYLISSPDASHEVKLPVLANTSATLVLFGTKEEEVIDEVCYSSKWHAPSVKNEKGVALERIDPDGDSREETNWTSASATAGYGTPGYRNSQHGTPGGGEATGIEAPAYSEITKEYTIHYHLDESGYTCRAWVFDTAGKRIREITNHELLGIEGELTWDGLAANGTKMRTGVYIFYAELVHPQGRVKRYKEVFLVK
ncbi:MAG: lamin tail domain-containing protein [Parabacteroides sp.]|nr:lamin tail domain-containing protein [Parabacteroides sp.]